MIVLNEFYSDIHYPLELHLKPASKPNTQLKVLPILSEDNVKKSAILKKPKLKSRMKGDFIGFLNPNKIRQLTNGVNELLQKSEEEH